MVTRKKCNSSKRLRARRAATERQWPKSYIRRGCGWLAALLVVAGALYHPDARAGTDIDGDGKTDVLWRQFSGQPLLWLMNGLTAPSELSFGFAPGNSWAMLGTGSFDGSGKPQLAFLNSGGGITIWVLDKGQYTGSCSASLSVPTAYTFVGIGDVDGDGKSDLLWKDDVGHIILWSMNLCSASSTTLGAVPAGFAAIAAGDFNGNGYTDVLWRDADGTYSVSLLHGTGISSTLPLNPAIPTSWQLATTFDLDADGRDELVWRLPDGSVELSYFEVAGGHTEKPITPTATDEIFGNDFEANSTVPAATLPLNWHLIDVGNYSGGNDRNLLFVDDQGNYEIWDVSGTSLLHAARFFPKQNMPYAGGTGWVLPVERPTVTRIGNQVTIAWPAVPSVTSYTLYASADHDPIDTGAAIVVGGASFSYARDDAQYENARYFGVVANLFGQHTPPSLESYLLEFNQLDLGYAGPMTVADINGDGCLDIVGALGDCLGGFSPYSEAAMGMSALRAGGRAWRDLRFADFDGDGIDDAIANVYSCDVPECGGNDLNSQILLFKGNGDGTFVEDPDFTALNIPGGGFGETIVIADFDNDGSLDVFLPKYTFYDSSEKCFLLMNDGHGHFIDLADNAGVAMRNITSSYRPEGAQAADIDGDGRIDLYAGSHLFMNRTTAIGQPLFVDQAAARGLQPAFDEGAKFIDWNNDGNLDLIVVVPWAGPQIWQNNGYSFQQAYVAPPLSYNNVDGFNAADVDGDGRPDLLIGGGCPPALDYTCEFENEPHSQAKLLLNRGTGYVQSFFYDDGFTDSQRPWSDLLTVADFDASGTLDVASRFLNVDVSGEIVSGNTKILTNRATSEQVIRITVLGSSGEHNQFGRVVRVSPLAEPGFVMTQIVDGGSGYMSNTPYTLQFAAPYAGAYRVDVGLGDRTVESYVEAGSNLLVYADGQTSGAKTPAKVTLRSVTP